MNFIELNSFFIYYYFFACLPCTHETIIVLFCDIMFLLIFIFRLLLAVIGSSNIKIKYEQSCHQSVVIFCCLSLGAVDKKRTLKMTYFRVSNANYYVDLCANAVALRNRSQFKFNDLSIQLVFVLHNIFGWFYLLVKPLIIEMCFTWLI